MNKQAYFKLMGLVKQAAPGWSDQQLTKWGISKEQWPQYRTRYYSLGPVNGKRMMNKYLKMQNYRNQLRAAGSTQGYFIKGKLQPQPSVPTTNNVTTGSVQKPNKQLLPDKETISDQASEY